MEQNRWSQAKEKASSGCDIQCCFQQTNTGISQDLCKGNCSRGSNCRAVSSIMKTWDVPVSQEKVEIVIRLPNYSSFRVTVQVPKQHMHFWKEETRWHQNIKVMRWNGDPDLPISPQNTRETIRRIVIGKVEVTQSAEQILQYITRSVYGEISQHIKEIQVKRNPNPAPGALYSAVCVTVVTKPGQEAAYAFLKNGLMRNKYP